MSQTEPLCCLVFGILPPKEEMKYVLKFERKKKSTKLKEMLVLNEKHNQNRVTLWKFR